MVRLARGPAAPRRTGIAGIHGVANLSGYINAEGNGLFKTTLPMYPAPLDIHIQVLNPMSGIFSHPLTMEMNQ